MQNRNGVGFLKKICNSRFGQNVVPKRLILDFLRNGSKDFLHIGNLDETNDYLSFPGGPRF